MRRRLLFVLLLPSLAIAPLCIYSRWLPKYRAGVDTTEGGGRLVVTHVVANYPLASAGVQVGDTLLTLDGHPLSNWGTYGGLLFAAAPSFQHRLEYEHAGQKKTVTFVVQVTDVPGGFPARLAVAINQLIFTVAGLLLWFKGRGVPMAEYVGYMLLVLGLGTYQISPSAGTLLALYPFHLGDAAFVLHMANSSAALAMAAILANNLSGRPLVTGPGWKWLLAVPTATWAALVIAWHFDFLRGAVPDQLTAWSDWAGRYLPTIYLLGSSPLTIRSYFAAQDANQRRRMRILLAGFGPAGVAVIASPWLAPLEVSSPLGWLVSVGITACFAAAPTACVYGLLTQRLFDVSVIIRRGLQYALTRASLNLLAGVFLFVTIVMPLTENFYRPLPELLAQKRIWIGLAGWVLLMARRGQIHRALDKRFFRDAYDPREVQLDVARLLAKRDDLERDGRQIAGILSRALHAEYGALLLRPSRVLLAGEPRELQPLPKTSRIPGLLELTGKPLEVDLGERKSFLHQLPEDDQALLRAWKAGALAPVGEAKVEAILLLGEKLSEQPYSGEDLKLIQSVAGDFTTAYFTGTQARQCSGERMRECPRCRTCYSEEVDVCPTDGAALLDSALSLAVAGRYRLQRRLGAGGMGVVYQATDSELARSVAVKVIRPESVADPQTMERFRREARAAASLSHPNIVAVYDFGTLPGGGAFLVMEYVEGQSLRYMMPLALPQALEVLGGVVAALETAHQAGLIHRDLKPDNVMVASARVKVLDFGLAKNLTANEETLTQEGRLAGTLAYMAPEQLYGGTVDARTDIYALGVTAHEVLTGRRPEHGQSPYAAVRRALSSKPSERQSSVREFFDQLKASS